MSRLDAENGFNGSESRSYVSRAFLDHSRLSKDSSSLSFIAATEGRKRDGLSLSMDAKEWDLSAYRTNPVFLWHHNQNESHDGTPIGSAAVKFENNQMRADVSFDSEDEFAMKVKGKYERKFLNSVSIRWIPARISESGKNELLEISAVPIPADPDAIQISARSFKDELEDVFPKRDAGPLDHDQLYDRLSMALKSVYPLDSYGYCNAHISMVYDDFVIVYDYKSRRHFKHTYTTSSEGEVTIADMASSVEVLMVWQEVSTLISRSLENLTPKQFEELQRKWAERHYQTHPDNIPAVSTSPLTTEVMAGNITLRAAEVLRDAMRPFQDVNQNQRVANMIRNELGGRKP
ncbi:MAG: hypothetical protein ACRDBG_17720 [Waterburya sp.]